jgi:hypothetical protein
MQNALASMAAVVIGSDVNTIINVPSGSTKDGEIY